MGCVGTNSSNSVHFGERFTLVRSKEVEIVNGDEDEEGELYKKFFSSQMSLLAEDSAENFPLSVIYILMF